MMGSILKRGSVAKLPTEELQRELREFLKPVVVQLPEKRWREVAVLMVQGLLTARSPVLAAMARSGAAQRTRKRRRSVPPLAKRFYRFVWSAHFTHRQLLKGLYGLAQRVVAQYGRSRLIVALDPVNFEKPYSEKLEGVSTVLKSTPPGPEGEKRLTPGYPAITATIVNLPEPVITYANWFSYKTADFISQGRELYRSIRITRALLPQARLHFVGDSEMDDQKVFAEVARVRATFTFRVKHWERLVEVYNDRLARWETESVGELAATVPFVGHWQVTFQHARRLRRVTVGIGWLKIRLPGNPQVLWLLVANDPDLDRQLGLITNVPIRNARDARRVYEGWRYRPQIEHTYRFDQERGLDVEDLQVRTLERMRRVFVLTLLATLFVYHIDHNWPKRAVLWLRYLGGKLGLSTDRDGPYVLLLGISAVFVAAATLAYAATHPFPQLKGTYG
jgi:hypothetical protein